MVWGEWIALRIYRNAYSLRNAQGVMLLWQSWVDLNHRSKRMLFRNKIVVCAALIPALACAVSSVPSQEHAVFHRIVNTVSAERLHAIDTKLVSFGTRHTSSETKSDTRGIGAARRWVKSRFESISSDCSRCLKIITPSRLFTGKRTPKDGVEVKDIVAIQKGSEANRYIVMTAHLDSRVTDVMNSTADAPGADDDGSGIAAMLEVARILSHYHFAATIVYSADSGEEQGLYGGHVIADYAKAHHWNVEADINNDMIGNTHGSDGIVDNTTGRLFSEGVRQGLTDKQLKLLRYEGGFVDSPSRNVARYIVSLTNRYVPHLHLMLMYRQDRFHRGGDQMAFNENGFPAVRMNEAHENWRHQHQDVRVENGIQYGDLVKFVDFPYLAKMTAANAVAIASMAWAPAPPTDVAIHSELSPDTDVSWKAPTDSKVAGYRVYWRRTSSPTWQHSVYVGNVTRTSLKNRVIDNYFFGVSSVGQEGFESPVVFPGAGGAFPVSGADGR